MAAEWPGEPADAPRPASGPPGRGQPGGGVAIPAQLGYNADAAGNGREAVAAVADAGHGAVLMDCQLPVMDGHQATAEIRRREPTARHRLIIAMTAAALQGDPQRRTAAEFDRVPSVLDAVVPRH
jgi:CheY-like chemotaxis protein